MSSRKAFAIGIPIALAIVLIAVFPVAARFAEGAALSIRRFWWLVLILAVGVWVFWTLQSRNRE